MVSNGFPECQTKDQNLQLVFVKIFLNPLYG